MLLISALLSTSCSKNELVKVMPITTDSELALKFYETGILASDQYKLSLAWHNFELAVCEDPDFFMAHFWMYFISSKGSKEVAEKVLQCDASLNEAEKQIKAAFKYLLDGQHDKVVEHLQVAIDLYPSDPHVHKILYVIQFQFLKDYEGTVKTIHRAIEERPDYALAYNMLGYAHMDMEEYDKAEDAFDNYIKMAPAIANPYDSKGDFYMTTEQFHKAYENYMKAFEIDSGFVVSKKKAMKAKQLQTKLER